jgi:hypothetical protein
MIRLVLLSILLISSGCTVSIILTDTHGTATDVVDSTPTTETETDLRADIPAGF